MGASVYNGLPEQAPRVSQFAPAIIPYTSSYYWRPFVASNSISLTPVQSPIQARNISTSSATALAATDVLKFQSSPILLERTTAKNEKYSRLLWIAKKQAQQKKRKQAPQFSTFCVSDFGELSPSAIIFAWISAGVWRSKRGTCGWVEASGCCACFQAQAAHWDSDGHRCWFWGDVSRQPWGRDNA